MKVLLVSPIVSAGHLDSGIFWLKALGECGISVVVWDYRISRKPPSLKDVDFSIVLKGEGIDPNLLPRPVVNFWPDAFSRDNEAESILELYDHVFTSVTLNKPDKYIFFPLGFDPDLHRDLQLSRYSKVVFYGTATERKIEYLTAIEPDFVFGNGWTPSVRPVYGVELVNILNQCALAVNIHRDNVGVTRRLFEMIACCPTITDLVPGVEEVLGPQVTPLAAFREPEAGKLFKEHYLSHPDKLAELWDLERKAVAKYTYRSAIKEVLKCLGLQSL